MIWIPLLVGAALLLNAVRLRARLAPLRRIPATVETGAPAAGSGQTTDEYGLLTAPRVVLPVEFRQAAIAYARRERLEMLDLIPADLPVMAALDLARSVDAATYRADFTGPVGGAGFATLVKTDVLTRARLTPGPLDPGDYGAALRRLRKYTDAADLAVTRARSGPARSPAVVQRTRRAWTRGIGRSVFETTVGSVVGYGLVLLALAIEPVWGLLAVAAYCAVPYVVCTAGIPITPCDLHRAALLRPVLTPWSWWRTAVGREPRREASADTAAREARQWYRTELARGVERFLEPRRDDCPWCGSRSLRKHVTSGDIVLRKPGRFTLEKCQECGHVFQNPRLTLDGLTFYYRDFYDGPNGEIMELAFNGASSVHRARAELLSAHLRPKTWLDVGTAAGGFCRVARTVLPDTEFDGLDFGASVEEGERRGWLRRGFRGLFPDLVDDLAGRYDVISMYHYLEHTRDPFVELDTAVKVLGPGGHLLIELPDPESRFSRLLGRCWVPWLQPQHLNMIPIGNLKRALAARGMHIVAEQRRAAHSRCDFFLAALVLLHNFGPPGRLPWSSETTFGDRVRRKIAVPLMLPLGVAGLLVDRLAAPLIPGPGNAYRVLARKEEG